MSEPVGDRRGRRVRLAVRTLSILLMMAMVGHAAAGERGQGPPTLQIMQAWVPRTPLMASVEQGSHGGSMLRPDQSALYVIVHNRGHQPEALARGVQRGGDDRGTPLNGPSGRDAGDATPDAVRPPSGRAPGQARGGAHLMLLELTQALRAGETIPVPLTFQHAGPCTPRG